MRHPWKASVVLLDGLQGALPSNWAAPRVGWEHGSGTRSLHRVECQPPREALLAAVRETAGKLHFAALLATPDRDITATRVRFGSGRLGARRRNSRQTRNLGGAGEGVRTLDIQLGNREAGIHQRRGDGTGQERPGPADTGQERTFDLDSTSPPRRSHRPGAAKSGQERGWRVRRECDMRSGSIGASSTGARLRTCSPRGRFGLRPRRARLSSPDRVTPGANSLFPPSRSCSWFISLAVPAPSSWSAPASSEPPPRSSAARLRSQPTGLASASVSAVLGARACQGAILRVGFRIEFQIVCPTRAKRHEQRQCAP